MLVDCILNVCSAAGAAPDLAPVISGLQGWKLN